MEERPLIPVPRSRTKEPARGMLGWSAGVKPTLLMSDIRDTVLAVILVNGCLIWERCIHEINGLLVASISAHKCLCEALKRQRLGRLVDFSRVLGFSYYVECGPENGQGKRLFGVIQVSSIIMALLTRRLLIIETIILPSLFE